MNDALILGAGTPPRDHTVQRIEPAGGRRALACILGLHLLGYAVREGLDWFYDRAVPAVDDVAYGAFMFRWNALTTATSLLLGLVMGGLVIWLVRRVPEAR